MIGQIDTLLYKMESDLAILIGICTLVVMVTVWAGTYAIIVAIKSKQKDTIQGTVSPHHST